jgi:hypothetical protein
VAIFCQKFNDYWMVLNRLNQGNNYKQSRPQELIEWSVNLMIRVEKNLVSCKSERGSLHIWPVKNIKECISTNFICRRKFHRGPFLLRFRVEFCSKRSRILQVLKNRGWERIKIIKSPGKWTRPHMPLPGTDVMIFKIFSPKTSAKKWRFWLKTKVNYTKIWP